MADPAKKPTVATYQRAHPSSAEALAEQRRSAHELAQRAGYEVMEEPVDAEGETPMLRKAMEELADGSVDAVVMALEDGTPVTLTKGDPNA